MRGKEWEQMIPAPDEGDVSGALERIRARAAERRSGAARRRRLLVLAAAFVLTFAAGWLAGQATASGRGLGGMLALRGQSFEESRATFVAVPAGNR